MKISDFRVGQSVFVMGEGQTRQTKYQTYEATVVNVGRKYVTISGNWGLKFGVFSERLPYLVEKTELGEPRHLFPSKEAVEEYCERERLKEWVCAAVGWEKVDCYSTAQLRAVKEILEGKTAQN